MWMTVQGVVLASAVALLVPAAHFGATLTHGEGFLMEHAPGFLRGLLDPSPASAAARVPPESLVVYDALVAPALQAHCVTCHGPAKAEGGLRLDSHAALTKGGDHGAVVAAGRAEGSEIVQRIYLPPSHEDVMPPRGHRPMTPADAQLLAWWIDQGARGDLTLGEAEISKTVAPVIEAMVGPLDRGGPAVPAGTVPSASADAIAAVVAAGLSVEPVSADTPYLHAHATAVAGRVDDRAVAALAGIAPQVLWLNLAGTKVTDSGLATIARLPNLTRLHLQRTDVSDAGLEHLARLAHLEYLNLYGTKVTDAGLRALAGLTSLRSLYLWQTGVTDAGVAELTAALPRLVVND
jgi:mono/diheme cytochrome c family protein